MQELCGLGVQGSKSEASKYNARNQIGIEDNARVISSNQLNCGISLCKNIVLEPNLNQWASSASHEEGESEHVSETSFLVLTVCLREHDGL
jgi:hypothetical protein